MKRIILRSAMALVLLVVVALVGIKLKYGGGERYGDLSAAPTLPEAALSAIELPFPPGNVTTSRGTQTRVFFNYHPFAKASRFVDATVFEWVDGRAVPFPDASFQKQYQGVFGLTCDRQDRLWMIEPSGLDFERTRLLAFDIVTQKQVFEYWFPPKTAQFAQDLRVSPDGNTVYLADTGLFRFTPASLIVFDVAKKTFHLALQGSASAQPQNWAIQTAFGTAHKLGFGLVNFNVGLDGIELSPDGETLFFGTMSHDTLFRVPTKMLNEANTSAQSLEASIAAVGKKPLSDGITLDTNGDLLLTDVEHGALLKMKTSGELSTWVKSAKIIWADGVSVTPSGTVWFTDSAIPAYIDQLARPPTEAVLKSHAPYHLYSVKP
jgi:Major royal jelly protein